MPPLGLCLGTSPSVTPKARLEICREGPDPFDAADPLAGPVVPEQRPDPAVEGGDTLAGPCQFVADCHREFPDHVRHPVLAAAFSGGPDKRVPQMADGAGDGHAMFGQQAPHPVRQPRPTGDQSLPDPVDSLQLEPLR
ncbi:hypothetical protein [Mangrovicoccus sp. HB161399]|uniref:hypothetical protein n=1 Tax=Mangrovicoccus sp. HB161399 TaxID=2720392 RepID=UPI0015516AFE|nr:hypothetical protein [Mangrovicoccus sp. HB161399]